MQLYVTLSPKLNRLLVLHNVGIKLYIECGDNLALAVILNEWQKMTKVPDSVVKKFGWARCPQLQWLGPRESLFYCDIIFFI